MIIQYFQHYYKKKINKQTKKTNIPHVSSVTCLNFVAQIVMYQIVDFTF